MLQGSSEAGGNQEPAWQSQDARQAKGDFAQDYPHRNVREWPIGLQLMSSGRQQLVSS